ncbi:UNVERIFIED_CONTAM: hypothetical protein Sradi_5129200 [Sesamum radiatum]|uniref:Uncharacterized protein n=1 Tax=Sesamum radiatum TaxID=300843 RepID=A0AAW2M431_SESRA
MAVLQGLRLQLGCGGSAGLRERRGARAVVEGARRHGRGVAQVLWAVGGEEDRAGVGQEDCEGNGISGSALEDQCY